MIKDENLIKIYSHPRSGTHFLEAFLAKNFYQKIDLSSEGSIEYGHWSNKKLLEKGEPYHKLFGSHYYPDECALAKKMIYISRDGRAVIASIWNTNFYNKDWEGITFSEFLRKKIDWTGGMGRQMETEMNIVQHWYHHNKIWHDFESSNLIKIKFEDLKNNPTYEYRKITKSFFPIKHFKETYFKKPKVVPIIKKVGIEPNAATIGSWKELFSEEDLIFFHSQIENEDFLYINYK